MVSEGKFLNWKTGISFLKFTSSPFFLHIITSFHGQTHIPPLQDSRDLSVFSVLILSANQCLAHSRCSIHVLLNEWMNTISPGQKKKKRGWGSKDSICHLPISATLHSLMLGSSPNYRLLYAIAGNKAGFVWSMFDEILTVGWSY